MASVFWYEFAVGKWSPIKVYCNWIRKENLALLFGRVIGTGIEKLGWETKINGWLSMHSWGNNSCSFVRPSFYLLPYTVLGVVLSALAQIRLLNE